MLRVTAIDHLVLNVRDLEVSADWYARVLGMVRHDGMTDTGDTRTTMSFGRNKINLRPVATSQDTWFTGATPAPGSADICFLTEASPEDVAAHLRDQGVAIELGPVTKSGARGPIRSVYVRDPDGSLIEVSSYPDAA